MKKAYWVIGIIMIIALIILIGVFWFVSVECVIIDRSCTTSCSHCKNIFGFKIKEDCPPCLGIAVPD